jgi:hypothetical protein
VYSIFHPTRCSYDVQRVTILLLESVNGKVEENIFIKAERHAEPF